MKDDLPVTEEVINLARNYDMYTQMIENSGQRQDAEERNRKLEAKLRALGVVELRNKHFIYTI